MKLLISTALLFLLAGAPSFAWQEPEREKDKSKPAPQQEEPRKQAPEREKPQQQEREKQQPDRQQQEKQQDKQQQKQQKDAQKQENPQQKQSAKQQQDRERVQQQQQGRAPQAQRDGANRGGRRIREQDFHTHFGREHRFHVERRDDRRFQYSSYWFEFSDPWPVEWNYDDDVYVDEIDGDYYLINPVHPGFRVLVIVVD
jgi:flagellar motor protein MotB